MTKSNCEKWRNQTNLFVLNLCLNKSLHLMWMKKKQPQERELNNQCDENN